MAQWMVKVAGHEFDLKTLSKLYTEPSCRVVRYDDAYYLTCDTFAALTQAGEVHSAAHELLEIVNADMQLRNVSYESVSLDSVIRVNDDGTQSRHVHGSAIFRGSGKAYLDAVVIGPDGQPIPSPEPARAQARLSLIERDERAREALDYSQRCNPNDADSLSYAYKISEIILEDLGGGDTAKGAKVVSNTGWSTDDEMQSFKVSVHSRAISGRKARHAGTRHAKSGVKPMSEAEAITYIKRILREWLDWKAEYTG